MARQWGRWFRLWGPAIAYLVLIFIASSFTFGAGTVPSIGSSDKLIHGSIYAVLCYLLWRPLSRSPRHWVRRWSPLWALLLTSLYGISDEIHQGFVGRDADVLDWVADTVGAAIVAAALMFVVELRRIPPEDRAI